MNIDAKLALGTFFKCKRCDAIILVIKASTYNKHTIRCCNQYMEPYTYDFYKLPENK